MLLLSSFLLVAFCYKGFFVIIKTTHPFLLNFFFSLLCLDLTNDLLVLSTVLLTVHFWFSGDFTHTLENIATFWWWGWCLIFKRKKKKSLATSPHTFPCWPWVCALQMHGTGSIHCPSNESRCVLPEPPVVRDFCRDSHWLSIVSRYSSNSFVEEMLSQGTQSAAALMGKGRTCVPVLFSDTATSTTF